MWAKIQTVAAAANKIDKTHRNLLSLHGNCWRANGSNHRCCLYLKCNKQNHFYKSRRWRISRAFHIGGWVSNNIHCCQLTNSIECLVERKKIIRFFFLLYITVLYKCRPSTNCISPNGGFELLHSHFGLSVDNFEFWSRHACNVFKAIQLCIRFAVACHAYFLWPFRPTPNLFHPPMPSRSHSVFFLFLSFSNV